MKTRISFHGNDEGGALLLSVVLVMVISYLFMAYVPYVGIYQRRAQTAKERALTNIETANGKVLEKYDLR